MMYLLFLLSIGLATALAIVFNQLQQGKKDYLIAQQRFKEADKRLKEADRKYGGLVSREDAARELDSKIAALTDRLEQLNQQANQEEHELSTKISLLRAKLQALEEKDFVESFGFYESKYNFQEADDYKKRLDKTRAQQKQKIKDEQAAICHIEWIVGGSAKEGKKMTDDFIKLVLRAFNGECDAAVMKVKYNNIKTMENRIRKAHEELNKLSKTNRCEITSEFLDLKLQELWLTHEYQEKKYQEQEEQRIIREQMREEEKALREIEKARQDAEKEERRYKEALEKARREVESAKGKAQEKLLSQIEELQKRLVEAEANKQRAISQAQMTKTGHVYIISNIGAFGEDVYKIGMTRRLVPEERVKELSDASVPFPFDIHALIYCQNAPELESQLHKRFSPKRINKVNNKKEFFRISLDEIVRAVREIDQELKVCKSKVRFTKVAEAAEYRKTLAKEREEDDKN